MSSEKNDALDGPGAILAQLREKLEATEGADKDLAAILARHVLVEAPVDSCVTDAKAAIAALAERRANPTPLANDGGTA